MAEDTSNLRALVFQIFLLSCLFHLSSALCDQDAIGLGNNLSIPDSWLTASSELGANTPAKNGRLNYTAGPSWCASSSDNYPYLEIDLQIPYIICAVSSQGNHQADQWVKTFSLQSSTDGRTWTNYTDDQVSIKIFSGNSNRNTIVKHILYLGIAARYVRFVAGLKHSEVCMRAEIFGAPSYSIKDLAFKQPADQVSVDWGGVASRAVDGDKRTYWYSDTCMHTDFANDAWWRVDLAASLPVAEVVIVNRNCFTHDGCAAFMNAFEIRIGNETSTNTSCGGTLSLGNGETKSFYCDPPVVGRYVSVVIPGTRRVLTICEVEVYSIRRISNAVTACRMNPVGVSSCSIINFYNQKFSASSSRSRSAASNGRLNGNSAWIPSSNNNNDYLQIDLGSLYVVCAVATQGNPSADDWTETYKIKTSLNNVKWQWYQENNTVKIFTGNNSQGRAFIVKNNLENPLAIKFIRFYPVAYHNNKALRVEVYGSKQGCMSSVGNEEGVPSPPFSVTASSQLDSRHRPDNSVLYGASSWCSSGVASTTQYLQFDFGKVVTVSGIATQGDAVDNKWVTQYAVSYGYDEQSWLDYTWGQNLTGNSDKSSVVVHWFTLPFAAQYVRILPKNYYNAQCMRVDLFGCRDFQAAFLYVNVKDVRLPATYGASVTLNCITKSSKRQPHAIVYEWSKDGVKLPDKSSSLLTVTYSNASDINNEYHCVSLSSPSRDVRCTAVYQCSASLVTVVGLPEIKSQGNSSVTVFLKRPGEAVLSVIIPKVTTASVAWCYSPGADEAPTSITLHYWNSTFSSILNLQPGSSFFTVLTQLKPFAHYSVKVRASSVLGDGLWSTAMNFTTLAEAPPAPNNPGGPQKIEGAGLSVNLTIWPATEDNGPISYYQILVHRVQSWTDTISDWNNFGCEFYISAQIPASVVKTKMIFLLGDGENGGGFTNKELSSGQKYKIYSRALTEVASKKRSTGERFLIGEAQLLVHVEVQAGTTEQRNVEFPCYFWR